jgi:hypothetical protein
MRISNRNVLLFVAILLIAACGGRDNVASRSAAAYQEAREKGIEITGDGHDHDHHAGGAADGHADHTTGDAADPHAGHAAAGQGGVDHSAHGMTSGSGSAQMDHSAAGHGAQMMQHGTSGQHGAMQHGAAQHGTSGQHGAMQHGTAQQGTTGQHGTMQHGATGQHGAMQHGTAQQGAIGQHGAMQHGAAQQAIAPEGPQASDELFAVQPASTLRADPFDRPVPISVAEAEKAAGEGDHGEHEARGITPGEDRENPPTSAPAVRDAPLPATGHEHHPPAAARPAASPADAVVYVCPMHPEVTSDRPGSCPKCGMALVRKK